jgi:hypothetical protein
MKELKEQFPVLAEQGSFDEPEEVDTVEFCGHSTVLWTHCSSVDTVQFCGHSTVLWTHCISHCERKLSNEELMQTHDEFGLATWDA